MSAVQLPFEAKLPLSLLAHFGPQNLLQSLNLFWAKRVTCCSRKQGAQEFESLNDSRGNNT